MSDLYALLACKKGASYRDDVIINKSFLKRAPEINKPPTALAGNSRVHGDAVLEVQRRVIDMLVEIGTRYGLTYREIAYVLLMCKIESGFNPDAAAGTTSAAGLGQYTDATAVEAEKNVYSKTILGFTLNISEVEKRFDAELGCYALILSYLIGRSNAKKKYGSRYEEFIYVFHHEGWYYNKDISTAESAPGFLIAEKDIIPKLISIQELLKNNNKIQFTLQGNGNAPIPNQPYVLISSKKPSGQSPSISQSKNKDGIVVVQGRTDGSGKTGEIDLPGLSEVVLVLLNPMYKKLINSQSSTGGGTHTVKKGETLSTIAKAHGVSLEQLAKDNNIKDVNKIAVGQELHYESAPYVAKRPQVDFLQMAMEKLGLNDINLDAALEYAKSHIMLPKGSEIQKPKSSASNEIVIRASNRTAKDTAEKKEEHQTKKEVEVKKVEVQVPIGKHAPWMEVALAEAQLWAGKKESKIDDTRNYHAEVGLKGTWKDKSGDVHDFKSMNNTTGSPWCASFVNYCLKKSGFPMSNSKASAISFSSKPKFIKIDIPIYGAIAVFSRKGGGHVGFVVGMEKDTKDIVVLGGNQGDSINFVHRSMTKNVVGFFVPSSYIAAAKKELKDGVKLLEINANEKNSQYNIPLKQKKTEA